jgi:hypothetical protein
MAVFTRHHRLGLVRQRHDDTLTTRFALNVVLRVRHDVHRLTQRRESIWPSTPCRLVNAAVIAAAPPVDAPDRVALVPFLDAATPVSVVVE